ncbi:MAG TPA: beta-galactosidase [Planctomycetota bacterium]|nr:beta-galactosidase [Planctomycetota bacterium]
MKYLGCAYYPEFWGPKRFAEDARLMREAGINVARIGEFAWCRMEPEEGAFTLDWLHDCVEALAKQKVDVLMCTPTATPPAWLTSKYPDICLVRGDGSRAVHGTRRHYCSTSDTYRRHSDRITETLAVEMSRHKNVVAWQLDNEFGPESGWCHCSNCQSRFRTWLQHRYGSIDELNRAWATGFWSMDYTDWSQVFLADPGKDLYSSRKLDSKRFWSDMMIDFALRQTAIIRRNHPSAMVTTNGMGPIFPPTDYYKLFGQLDVACDDLYFDIGTQDTNACAMNVFRSMKPGQRYWITETGSGALDHGKPPHAEQFRAWAWSNIAHGGDAHMVFRWRTCLSGQEQELQGILEHSGKPGHRYRAVQACFREIAALRNELKDLPLPQAPVAFVQDYNVLWAYESARIGNDVNYLNHIFRIHRELYARNILADVVPPGRDLSGYKLVVLPTLMMIDEAFAASLRKYVRGGGTVFATGQIGIRDFNDNYLPAPGPQHLESLLGVTIDGGMYLHSCVGPDEALWVPRPNRRQVEVPVAGNLGQQRPPRSHVSGSAGTWIADLTLAGGSVMLEFTGDDYQGQPAAVQKKTGKGWSIYLGAVSLNESLFDEVIDYVLDVADIMAGPKTPAFVEVVERGPATFVVSHIAEPVDIALGRKGKAIVGTYEDGTAKLGPYGVCVITE